MKKLAVLFALSLIISSLSSNVSFATEDNFKNPPKFQNSEHKGKDFKKNHEKLDSQLDERLKLTKLQKEQAKLLREKTIAKIKPIFEQLKAEREKVIQARQTGISPEAMEAHREKVKSLFAQVKLIQEENLASFEQILSPSQKKEFEKVKAEMKQKREKMMQKHRENRKNHEKNKQ